MIVRVFIGLLALLAASGSASAFGTDSGHEPVERDTVVGGEHWRLETPTGIVHVWHPRLYERDTAGVMIYIHGYYTTVDEAWAEHRLAEQFRDSKQNAFFIVPQAPTSDQELVIWKDLDQLLDTVRKMTKQRLPSGQISTLAHSGGFRTIVEWIKSGRLDQIILLDGLYFNEDSFGAWLKTQKRKRAEGPRVNKLIVVASETVAKSDAFVKRFRKAVTHGRIPDNAFELNKAERNAEVLYMRTTDEHMQLVTEGKVIPLLIKLAPFPKL
jgi:hypothetical protein